PVLGRSNRNSRAIHRCPPIRRRTGRCRRSSRWSQPAPPYNQLAKVKHDCRSEVNAARVRAVGKREYGQFCGLARAAEVLGQRWTLLILRDLLTGPRRYSDLTAGLPGIPSNILATRLKELEGDGLVTRELRG